MIVLMLDPKRVVVEATQKTLFSALRNWRFEPIPCPFLSYAPFGGSFHCATLDYPAPWRAGNLLLRPKTVRSCQSQERRDIFFESFLRRKADMLCDDFPAPIDDKCRRYRSASKLLHQLEVSHHNGIVHPEILHEFLDHRWSPLVE